MLRRQAAETADDSAILEMSELFTEWKGGTSYKIGDILRHGAALYRVAQDHAAQAHQPPDAAGMLAIYTPVQLPASPGVDNVFDWISGETFPDDAWQGIQRRDPSDGEVYRTIQSPGANVWEPHTAPALWQIV
jgi:hypothetical protein